MKNAIRGLMGAGVVVAAGAFATSADAAIITLSGVCSQQAEGSNGLGNCTKTASYNDDSNLLTITLKNTSPAANGGFITADAFNLPENRFGDIGNEFCDDRQQLRIRSKFGDFSVAPNGSRGVLISTGGDFLGSGSPANGLGVNESATFTRHSRQRPHGCPVQNVLPL